jgi:ketosteroid isomerase-like protein
MFARGTEHDASRIPADEQAEVVAQVIRRFFRPMMQQARWIDPRPLADERSAAADTAVTPDPNWAVAIVEAANVRRVCPLTEGNESCRGLAGGVLRFSRPYGIGGRATANADSAIVFAKYSPVGVGGSSELEFYLVRRGGGWDVVTKRTLPDIPASAPARYVVTDPQEMVDSLLATDRAFSAAGRALDYSTTLVNMMVNNVVMTTGGMMIRGRDSVARHLESNAENAKTRVSWTPIRGGVSSDLRHGFTFGYTTTTKPDGSVVPGKYVAYWVRGDNGWRVAAYRRAGRGAGDVSLALLPASLPTKGLPHGDDATVQRYADELGAAERAFSRDATPMGLGPAFVKWGAPDAVNVGGPTSAEFVRGNEAIGQSVSAGWAPGSKISWGPDQVIVSSTGDLGVSIGTIHVTVPGVAGQPETTRDVAFFTIWRRAWPTDPWRYVAE